MFVYLTQCYSTENKKQKLDTKHVGVIFMKMKIKFNTFVFYVSEPADSYQMNLCLKPTQYFVACTR